MAKRPERLRWRKVGDAAVDSGTLVVIDPCYVDDDKPVPFDELIGLYGTAAEQEPTGLICQTAGPGAQFVRLSAFGGDGVYPVYAARDDNGRVCAALVVFDGRLPVNLED